MFPDAIRLGVRQPAVSGALKRLRDLSGDPLLALGGPRWCLPTLPAHAGAGSADPCAQCRGIVFRRTGFEPPRPNLPWRPAIISIRCFCLAGGAAQQLAAPDDHPCHCAGGLETEGRLAGGKTTFAPRLRILARVGVISRTLDKPGPFAQHHRAVRISSAIPHRGFQLAGLDHRAPVLQTVHSAAAADPASPVAFQD